MTQPVVLYHLNQLFLGCFLAGDGLKLHGAKIVDVVELETLNKCIPVRDRMSIYQFKKPKTVFF